MYKRTSLSLLEEAASQAAQGHWGVERRRGDSRCVELHTQCPALLQTIVLVVPTMRLVKLLCLAKPVDRRTLAEDIVSRKCIILKLRCKHKDAFREAAFWAWKLHTRAVLGAASKLKFAVQVGCTDGVVG